LFLFFFKKAVQGRKKDFLHLDPGESIYTFLHSRKCRHFNYRGYFVFLNSLHHRAKINRAFTYGNMGIFFGVVIMEMVMSGGKREEFQKTVILVSMPHIECEANIPKQAEFAVSF